MPEAVPDATAPAGQGAAKANRAPHAGPLLVELPLEPPLKGASGAPAPGPNGAELPQASFTVSPRPERRSIHAPAPERRLLPLLLLALLILALVAAAWVYREDLAQGASSLLMGAAVVPRNGLRRATLNSEKHARTGFVQRAGCRWMA